MVESGLGGIFWFLALVSAKDPRNATYHERIKTTPHKMIYCQPKDLSKLRAFGCKAIMTLNKDRRGPGKIRPRGMEGVNLGFASDSRGYVVIFLKPGRC
jgi:hypothetical protein